VFALLYTVALVLDLGDEWQDPWFTGLFLLGAAAAGITGMTRLKFLILLVAVTSYNLVFRFPEVANHVNLTICLNVAMILAMAYSFVRHRNADTAPVDYFTAISPLLRLSLVLVYFLAGFHKLNSDYFNPEASCAAGFLGLVIAALRTSVLGIPAVVMVTAVGVVAGYRLSRRGRFGSRGSLVFTTVVVTIGSVGLGGALAILLEPQTGRAPALAIGMVAAAAVLGWELAGSLLLTVPRLQAAILAFSLSMHAALALVGFADFGALALALLFSFVPASYQQVLIVDGGVRIRGFVVHRVHIYGAIGIAVTLFSGTRVVVQRLPHEPLIAGLLFDLAVLIAIWPILATVFSPSPRPVWGGVRILNRRMPAFLYVFPVVLVLMGMTPYLGLRTAGNFSMFSNLRTEGDTSNHLLLGANPLKVWGYQEDIVWIVDIDDRVGQRIHHYDQSPRGYALPVVEFRKWIQEWSRAGDHVPLTYGYRGELHTTDDIVTDPRWRTDSRTPAMVLLDFRVIQPGQPNWCRW